MYPWFISLFITTTTVLLDLKSKSRKPAYQYVVLFFLIAGLNFLFSTHAQAEEFDLFRRPTFVYESLSN